MQGTWHHQRWGTGWIVYSWMHLWIVEAWWRCHGNRTTSVGQLNTERYVYGRAILWWMPVPTVIVRVTYKERMVHTNIKLLPYIWGIINHTEIHSAPRLGRGYLHSYSYNPQSSFNEPLLVAACIRCLQEGNVFSRVCSSGVKRERSPCNSTCSNLFTLGPPSLPPPPVQTCSLESRSRWTYPNLFTWGSPVRTYWQAGSWPWTKRPSC